MMYSYDEKGNPISAVDTAKNAVSSEYDEKDRLTFKTMQDGATYTYTYNSTVSDRLVSSSSGPRDQKTDYTYNSYGQLVGATSYNANQPENQRITSGKAYTANGKQLISETDSLGTKTMYGYESDTTSYGRLDAIWYDEDDTENYQTYNYDAADRIVSVGRKRNASLTSFITAGYTYTNSRLTSITHTGFKYNFLYDTFGNTLQTLVGTQPLITNTFAATDYNPDNDHIDSSSLLTRSTYGNGDYVEYDYDQYQRVVEKKYNGVVRFQYTYNSRGNIDRLVDKGNNTTYRYYYDELGRIQRIYGTNGLNISYQFDGSNRLTETYYTYGNQSKSTAYTYSAGGFLETAQFSNGSTRTYSYDHLARVGSIATKTSANASDSWQTVYGYYSPSAANTTALINSINHENINLNLTYTYDKFGNIVAAKENGVLKASYEYDYAGQLVRENNSYSGKTASYTYDNGGNIISRTEYDYTTGSLDGLTGTVVQYTYGNENWKDLLTAYNGNAITYDAIGNPLTYYNGTTFEWTNGRQLCRATKADGTYMSYRYNENGIRTRKSVNGTATEYLLDGSDIVAQKTGNNIIWFNYDATGNRHSIEYNGSTYYYYYNLQGDVIGLYDAGLNSVVQYTYDSWGKVLSVTGNMANTLGQANPFRYRGYYYDTETGLYYLNSRYYDPETGRVINADGYVSTGQGVLGCNMFTYCGNNPIARADSTGTISEWVVLGIIIVGTLIFLSGCSDHNTSSASSSTATSSPQSSRPSSSSSSKASSSSSSQKSNPTKTSKAGVSFIASYEGYYSNPYDDGFGNCTIGYGHVIRPGEAFGSLTEAQALDLLANDLSIWESKVTQYSDSIGVVWDQNEYDAFVSLAFNSGNNFKSVMDSIAAGTDPYTAFGTIINAGGKPVLGLYRRRMDEADIFVRGVYERTYRNW